MVELSRCDLDTRLSGPGLAELPLKSMIIRFRPPVISTARESFSLADSLTVQVGFLRQAGVRRRALFCCSLFADGARRGSGDGVPATLRWVGDQRRVAALVLVCGGGAGAQVRIPGALRAAGGVPRRTLNHAFQQVLGMGPVTYWRRLRLNQVRRSLRELRANAEPKSVTEIALDHGFWHLGRFSSQYRELFGNSPRESTR